MILTRARSSAISSSPSRSAAPSAFASCASIRPPGKLTCPPCLFRCALRLVIKMDGAGPRMTGTSTAAGTGAWLITASTSSPCATSPGSGSAAIAVSRARSSAAVIDVASIFAGGQLAQRKEPAAAPDAEHPAAADPLRDGQRDQLVIDGAIDPGLDAVLAGT